jgi:hypothetical protein
MCGVARLNEHVIRFWRAARRVELPGTFVAGG